MATQKQILANRSNALLSTGPRTDQGKAISRMNALKTSIDARNETAAGEDPSALAALADEYDREFQPIGIVERFIVDILVKDDWFLRRYRFLAADLVNHGAAIAFESKRGADCGAGFAANTESFQRLHRHIIETQRSFFTHLAELERRQALRRQYQADADSPVTDSPEPENPGIGFVPQPPPQPAGPAQPAAPPALTPSPKASSPTFGFVPHTTFLPTRQSPSAPLHLHPPLPTASAWNRPVRGSVPALRVGGWPERASEPQPQGVITKNGTFGYDES